MKNHFKEIAEIFSTSKPRETHVYMRNVEKVLDKGARNTGVRRQKLRQSTRLSYGAYRTSICNF